VNVQLSSKPMKKRLVVGGSAVALLVVAYSGAAQTSPALFFKSNVVPPLNGTYLSPAQSRAVYANGVLISNVTQRAVTETQPPPPIGTSATRTFNSEVDFDLSLNNGASFSRVSAPAQITVNLQAVGGSGGVQNFDTEMLQLNISGGSLPSGVQVRAGTSQLSTGQTTFTPTSGGYMVSSFFDIFTEVSLDGGQTWSPATQSTHVDLRPDPTLVPAVPVPTALVPPPSDVFVASAQSQAAFAGGIVIKSVRNNFFTQQLDLTSLPVGGGKQTEQFGSMASFQLSTDGGRTFSMVQTPATITVSLQKVSSGPPALFDTEMLQLDLSFSAPGSTLRLRESPTLPSYGETALQQMADGSFQLNSFFDIFTELSLDGGQTWQAPTNGPTHVELQPSALRMKAPVANMPPTNGQFNLAGRAQYVAAGSGIVLSNVVVRNMSPSFPLPPPGQNQSQELNAAVDMMVSLDSGQTFTPASAPAIGLVTISNTSLATASAKYLNTELVQLNISGGSLPGGLMIRESPTKASLGRASVVQDANGYRISSFFDVFTEVSLDQGQTWNPGVSDPSTIPLVPNLPYAPYVITCPSNITVYATSPSGAYVTYSFPPITIFPDCPFCCFTATGVPPSGSLFPIGTTTVTGYGSDGCGEHPTCTFTITVLPSLIYAGLAELAVNRALLWNSNYVTTNQYLVVSNLFTDSADGFSMNLGAADSAVMNFLPFSALANCPTDLVTMATGTFGSDANHNMGSGAYFGGSNPMFRVNFSSLGASSAILEVHDGDDNHLVYSNRFANDTLVSVNTIFPPPCSNYNTTVYTYWQSPDGICYRFCRFGCDCSGTNCYIERVACWRPDIATLPAGLHLSSLRVLGAAAVPPGSFALQGQELGLFGMRHMATGNGTFDSRQGILMLNGIGSSGQDGVVIDLGHAGRYNMMLAPTMVENTGALFGMAARGRFGGMEDAPLGFALLEHVGPGGGCIVQDDFTPIGASQTRVEIYQDSQLIGSITEPSGALGNLPSHGNLVGCGMLAAPLGFRARFDSAFVFVPQGGTSQFTGNELHLLAANPTGPVRDLSHFGVQAGNIPQIAIIGESAQPVITSALRQNNGTFAVAGMGAAGVSYRLLGAATLGPVNGWSTAATAMSNPDGSFSLMDTRPGLAGQQFYIVVTP
jgi:hypothetical protein